MYRFTWVTIIKSHRKHCTDALYCYRCHK